MVKVVTIIRQRQKLQHRPDLGRVTWGFDSKWRGRGEGQGGGAGGRGG